MSKFLKFLTPFLLGSLITLGLTGALIFYVVEFYDGHPHGMPGVLTAMAGAISWGIYLIFCIIMAVMNKTKLWPQLLTAFLLTMFLVGIVALFEA